MSKKCFTELERKHLSTNKYVLRVSDKAITYADEFKRLFIDQYLEGKTPRAIFEENGFDVTILGMKRVEQSADRWKKAVWIFSVCCFLLNIHLKLYGQLRVASGPLLKYP